MIYAILTAAGAIFAAYKAFVSAKKYRALYESEIAKAIKAEAELRQVHELYRQSQELRHALEKDLARLRSGTPSDRVGASLDILRDESKATGAKPRKPAPGVADLTAAARKP